MDLSIAEKIYSQIISSSLTSMVDKLIRSGIRYARLRVDWYLLPTAERHERDNEQRIAHDAFISSCNILSRNMGEIGEDISWRRILGSNRKNIGDIACVIQMIIGLRALL